MKPGEVRIRPSDGKRLQLIKQQLWYTWKVRDIDTGREFVDTPDETWALHALATYAVQNGFIYKEEQ